jgi:hypothetical protein
MELNNKNVIKKLITLISNNFNGSNITVKKPKTIDEIIDKMYSTPDFCPISNEKEICNLKELGFDCINCNCDIRKEFAGKYIESGGKVCEIPRINIETLVEKKENSITSISNSSISSIVESTNKDVEDEVIPSEPVINLSNNPILIVDNRGIIGIYDNPEKATNVANDIIVSGNSEEIIVYKPYRKVARSTKIDDL